MGLSWLKSTWNQGPAGNDDGDDDDKKHFITRFSSLDEKCKHTSTCLKVYESLRQTILQIGFKQGK